MSLGSSNCQGPARVHWSHVYAEPPQDSESESESVFRPASPAISVFSSSQMNSDRHRSHHDLSLLRRQFQPETGIAVSLAVSLPDRHRSPLKFQGLTGNGPASERTAGEPSQFSDRLRSNCHCLPVTVASGGPVLARARTCSLRVERASPPRYLRVSSSVHSQAGAATVTVAVQCAV